jgi:CHASE2 domain-containing sensor protein
VKTKLKALAGIDLLRVAAVLPVVVLAYYLQEVPAMRALSNSLYDWRLRMLAVQHMPSPDIVVVAIDEASLRELEPAVGRWPWPRAVMGSVVDYCSRARVVALDVLYPEGDWQYRRSDEAFVDAVAEAGNVVLAFHAGDYASSPGPSNNVGRFALAGGFDAWHPPVAYGGALAPFGDLLKAAAGVGHVNVTPDPDGVVRAHAPVVRVGSITLPSIALAAVMRFKGLAAGDVALHNDSELHVGDHALRLNKQGMFRLYPSRWEYPLYRVADVIRAWQAEHTGVVPSLQREAFKNKIVLVGSTATGLLDDSQVTPVSSHTGGVEVLATAVEDILHGRSVRDLGGLALVLIVVCAAIPAAPDLARPYLLLATVPLVATGYLLLCVAALFSLHWFLPIAGPMVALLLSGAVSGVLSWRDEHRRREAIEDLDGMKETLTSMLVHDLRNALSPVVMGLELAERNDDAAFMRELFLPAVKDSSEQLLCQINALLDIRRMESGRMTVRPALVNVPQTMEKIRQEYVLAAQRAEKTLALECADDPPVYVRVDAGLFDRLLRNLLWNAIKFATKGTAIQMGCRGAGHREDVVIFVRNHCEVIPREMQADLFQAFKVAENQRVSPIFHSVGLGLAFCKLAAETHHGSIGMQSPCPGWDDGVQITLTLPPPGRT